MLQPDSAPQEQRGETKGAEPHHGKGLITQPLGFAFQGLRDGKASDCSLSVCVWMRCL